MLRHFISLTYLLFFISQASAQIVSAQFNCTGAPQNFVVPSCVTSITVEAWGAGGGGGGWDSFGGSAGGGGAYVSSVLSVTPGQILTIITGCGGQPGNSCVAANGFGPGGYGLGIGGDGGNPGAIGCSGAGGGGGGGTGIMDGPTILLVAGGGGGGGGGGNFGGGADGGGGGQNGNSVNVTMGGTLGASGNTNGLPGIATNGDGAGGGGGGGGLVGGGGGNVPGTDEGGAGGAGGTNLGTVVLNGGIITPGNSGNPNLCAGCAAGGAGAPFGGSALAGGSGVLLLSYLNIPTPTVTANASANPVCAGSPVTLTGGGATSYTWTGGVTNGSPFSPGSTTTYTVTGETLGCIDTEVITVTVNTLPLINVNNAAICAGGSTVLAASGANTYTWSPGTNLSATTGANVTANPGATTTYTITGTDINNCSSTAVSTVTVNTLPVITANSAAICAGQQTAALSANGASSYTWFPGTGLNTTTGPNVSGNPPATTIYTITGTNINSCINNITATITVNALPTVTVNSGVICSSGIASLTATGANTYSWSPPSGLSSTTGASVTANPPAPTVYTVTGTDGNGCFASGNSTVIVQPNPTVTVNSAVICAGQTTTLTANGANTYFWTPSTGLNSTSGNTVNANPAVTTVYSVTGTDVNTCTNSAVTTITVNPLPNVTVNSFAICIGQQTATLTGSGATSYSWIPGTGLNTTSGNSVNGNPASTTIYTVIGTDANSCSNIATTTITVFSLPNLSVNSASICTNNSVTLITNGATSYTWSPGTGLSSTSGSNVSANPAATTVYSITGTDVNNCFSSVSSTVTVYSLPTITVNSAAICVGQQTAVLVANGASVYSWSPSTGLSSTSGNTISANPASSTNYTVTGTDVNSCTNTAVSNITVNTLPNVTVNSAAICKNQQTATLTANGAINYLWVPLNGLSTSAGSLVTANPGSTSTYTIVGTDVNSCTNTAFASVTVNPIPLVTVNSTTICEGQSANLVANGASLYSWTPGTGLNSSSGSNVIANPLATIVYTIEASDVNTCTNVATSTVVVNILPVIVVNSTLICVGQQTAVLNVNGALNYSWSPAAGLSSTTGNNILASPLVTTIYTVTGTDNANCSGIGTSTLTVMPLPSPVIAPKNMEGCEPLCVDFAEVSTISGSYIWTFGDGVSSSTATPSHCYFNDGNYVVRMHLTDIYGCKDSTSTLVKVHPTPVADFVFNPVKPHAGADDEVTFTNSSYNATLSSFSWLFTTPSVILSPEKDPVIKYTEAGEYISHLLVTSNHGCTDTISKRIIVYDDYSIFIPNAFTPDGNGLNETFQPKGLGFSKYTMMIFDRWGELIYETDELGNGWDGTFKKKSNNILPNDVYVYKITLLTVYGEKKEIVGHVSLIR